MRTMPLFATLMLLSAFSIQHSAFAVLPQPLVIYYGQALNEYGWPYTKNATVILRINGVEYARCEIKGALGPGINFAMQVFMDDGAGSRYDKLAARTGDPVEIVIQDAAGEKPILQRATLPPIPKPGQMLLLNVTTGESSATGGIPDTWLQELADNSNGQYADASQVDLNADLDGDGMSNLDEYRAGTIAFWDFDYFVVRELDSAPNQLMRLGLISVAGKAYSVSATTNLLTGPWLPCAYASTAAGTMQTGLYGADDYQTELFVALTNHPGAAVRLGVQD